MSEILDEVRLSDDGDAFGTVQEWRFAIADYLLEEYRYLVPGFRQAPSGPDEGSYAYQILVEVFPAEAELLYVLRILDRARSILGAMGRDY